MVIDIGKCVKLPNGQTMCYNTATGKLFKVEITEVQPGDCKPEDIFTVLKEVFAFQNKEG